MGKNSAKSGQFVQKREWGKVSELSQRIYRARIWDSTIVRAVAVLLTIVFAVWAVVMPLDGDEQMVFGVGVFLCGLYLRAYLGTYITLALISLSVIASTRYLYWRITDTINTATYIDAVLSIGLLIAEIYAWIVLLLGYFQTAWPLRRKPLAMPQDEATWPSVDVLIPTYNEPLSVVRLTVLAASLLDWPSDKLNVYLLDDGNREDFRSFAKELGVHYIAREDNRHAKAGNLNNALAQISGEFVAIFDCDHIPVRSFLKQSMGGFMVEPKLALVQTPHHFLSPDPFERNLGVFRKVPNEGALFYGLVQGGNDLWNSTFFCGSCAILRRTALDEVGGIATETVTEDAHTSLKMHRNGYTSAYFSEILAAGLATETMSAHVKQRMRWARGMVQIFRTDCPWFGRGLSLPQRLNYTNAIFHFLYGFPRLFFLMSPLAFLFFDNYIINAPAAVIAAYALPHVAMSFLTNSRVQGEYRQTFWNEVYETALAWYIFWPTLFAMLNPKAGKFNVTAKGGYISNDYFDWKIALPYIVLLILNGCGLVLGILKMFWWNSFEWDTVLFNLLWTTYNLMMITASTAVVWETKQIRKGWRVEKKIPAEIVLPSGKVVPCHTFDYSDGGICMVVTPDESLNLPRGTKLEFAMYKCEARCLFPVEMVGLMGNKFKLKFEAFTLEQERNFVGCTLSREDAWTDWMKHSDEIDHPLAGLKQLLRFSMLGLSRVREAARRG